MYFVEPKVGVGVMVVEDDRLLLVRRAMEPEKGRWSLPAGYLDYGESPVGAAVREAREETGLEVRITGLVNAFHNPPGAGATVFLLYRAERVRGEPTAGDDADAARVLRAATSFPPLAFASTFAAVELLPPPRKRSCATGLNLAGGTRAKDQLTVRRVPEMGSEWVFRYLLRASSEEAPENPL